MAAWVSKTCNACGKVNVVNKDLIYTGYECSKCGHVQKDALGSVNTVNIVSGVVKVNPEFRGMVDKIMSQKGANNNIRKY